MRVELITLPNYKEVYVDASEIKSIGTDAYGNMIVYLRNRRNKKVSGVIFDDSISNDCDFVPLDKKGE